MSLSNCLIYKTSLSWNGNYHKSITIGIILTTKCDISAIPKKTHGTTYSESQNSMVQNIVKVKIAWYKI